MELYNEPFLGPIPTRRGLLSGESSSFCRSYTLWFTHGTILKTETGEPSSPVGSQIGATGMCLSWWTLYMYTFTLKKKNQCSMSCVLFNHCPAVCLFVVAIVEIGSLSKPRAYWFIQAGWPVNSRDPLWPCPLMPHPTPSWISDVPSAVPWFLRVHQRSTPRPSSCAADLHW